MIEIIKKPKERFEMSCPKCGCVFAYEFEDVDEDIDIMVDCPICGKLIGHIAWSRDIEEVKHGHWVPNSDSLKADCSRCGRGRADIWHTNKGIQFLIKGEEANFCYVCDAKMDEKEDKDEK